MKIIGWEIRTFVEAGIMGDVWDQRFEYGNSPVRDKRARMSFIKELADRGTDFSVTPIFEKEKP